MEELVKVAGKRAARGAGIFAQGREVVVLGRL